MLTITPETPIAALTVQQFKELFFSSYRIDPPKESVPVSEPAIFGVKGCQKLTGYSASAIYQRTSNGLIPHFRRDGKLLFRRDEIINWMTEHRVETNAEAARSLDSKFVKRRRAAV